MNELEMFMTASISIQEYVDAYSKLQKLDMLIRLLKESKAVNNTILCEIDNDVRSLSNMLTRFEYEEEDQET